jgi:hypothetical protein
MLKKNSGNKKPTVSDEIDRLRQRRDDRKNNENKQDSGKVCDSDYENLIKKKKFAVNQANEDEQVQSLLTNNYKNSINRVTIQKSLY